MSQRILVVEDQEDNRQILRNLLSGAGFEVFEAEHGEAGVSTAVAHHPDLILIDIQLPILDGYEAMRRLEADPTLDLSHRRHLLCVGRGRETFVPHPPAAAWGTVKGNKN